MKNGRIPSNQVRGWRQVQAFTITADNQQLTIDLPRGPAIETVAIRISGTFNVGTLFTAVRTLAPLHLFRRLDWVLNGNITLDSVSGIGAYLTQSLTRRRLTAITPPASAAVGAKSIDAIVYLDRVLLDMFRPKDSVLKTDEGVTQNQLRVQMGALADMFTGAGAATYTSLTATVLVQDYQEAPNQSGRTPDPLYYIKRSEQIVNFPNTGNGQLVRISTGNRLRALIMRQEISGDGSNGNVSAMRLVRGGDTRVSSDVPILQAFNQYQFGGDVVPAGVVALDLGNPGMPDARYSEFWPLPSNADVQLQCDIATANTALRIVQLEGVDLARG